MKPLLVAALLVGSATAFADVARPADPAPAAAPEKLATDKASPEKPADKAPAKVDEGSPVGRWKTWDDSTGKPKSIVVITEEGGKLTGKIELLLNPKEPDPKCDKCEGDLKDVRVTGMRILWDLKKDGDEWSGGRVLDPENGKIYKCYIAVEEGGKRLKIRGFVGFALLGRTQHWTRE